MLLPPQTHIRRGKMNDRQWNRIKLEQRMEQGSVKRPGGGRPRLRPQRVNGETKAIAVVKFVVTSDAGEFATRFLVRTTNGDAVSLTRLSTTSATRLSVVSIVSSRTVALQLVMRKKLKTTLPC